jgi:hypothetical protein
MDSSLIGSIQAVCGILNKHAVQFLIVGGTAVALHGYYRQSRNLAGAVADKPDLDIWYNPTYGNYFSLLKALEELGQDVAKLKEEQAPNPKKSFFRYEFDLFTLDLLPELKAPLKFGVSFQARVVIALGGIDIPFISFDDLIADKETNARPQDIADVQQLKVKRNSPKK